MSKIGIWCIVSSDEYKYLQYTLCNIFNRPDIVKIVIVVTGPIVPQEFGYLTKISSKFLEIYKLFGFGFDIAVSDGGFDQVSARNYALTIIESFNVDWLIQYDADDFYNEKILDVIKVLEPNISGILCACYTIISNKYYWYTPAIIKNVRGIEIVNPHIRIWKSKYNIRYIKCNEAIKEFKNDTRHCGININSDIIDHIKILPEPYHYHLHCILNKRYSKNRSQRKKIDYSIPTNLLKCISSLKECNGGY